jgi:hypothetical protein
MYKPDPAKRHLIEEFRARPRGPYGLELTQLVNRTRMGPVKDRYVLVCTKRHAEWVLAQLPGERGRGLIFHWDRRFTDLDAAEWFVFTLRWQQLTGERLT